MTLLSLPAAAPLAESARIQENPQGMRRLLSCDGEQSQEISTCLLGLVVSESLKDRPETNLINLHLIPSRLDAKSSEQFPGPKE